MLNDNLMLANATKLIDTDRMFSSKGGCPFLSRVTIELRTAVNVQIRNDP